MNQFQILIKAIAKVLGPTSGIDSDDVNVDDLIKVMQQYNSNEQDWCDFALGDLSRNYTRNLVDDTNGKSNILVVVWNPGKGSPIHDHANAHCVMKILKGSLEETLYTEEGTNQPPQPFRQTTYHQNEVTYISDDIGLHKICNASATDVAISLHLYTPPHAHNFGFNVFDERSGKKSHVKTAPIFSDRGHVVASQKQVPFKPVVPWDGPKLATRRMVVSS